MFFGPATCDLIWISLLIRLLILAVLHVPSFITLAFSKYSTPANLKISAQAQNQAAHLIFKDPIRRMREYYSVLLIFYIV